MESRKLNKILNNTGYAVHFRDNKVCIGSPYVSELLTVDMEKNKIRYALDTFKNGRDAIKNKDLGFIWDKLTELIDSGELNKIVKNNDSIDGMIPVYFCEDGKIKKEFTEKIGWPNVTHTGLLMYDNTVFKTRKEATDSAIKDYKSRIEYMKENLEDKRKEIEKVEKKLVGYRKVVEQLELDLN